MKRLPLVFVLLFAVGCGTFKDTVIKTPHIYGGVRRDAAGFAGGPSSKGQACWLVFDMLLCAPLDTVLLPFTVTHALIWGEKDFD